ncbi:alpha-1,2-fucosyltransferase [Butyrivibrio sp. AC2005]|uniref:alpha-1,2-fucosyltransferase n=1 Tax=Butyrivibrio sp. AC2005 TaxID=1280672 RepID=UPI000404FA17|nr:alpha-1,2-fucosyltransferase [Butyrivibrio sp. AC2005]
MIIIRMMGGLGNQMFQYALYLQLKALGKEVKIDDVYGFRDDEQRDPVLEDMYGITYDKATDAEVVDITDSYLDIFSRIRRKLFGRKTKEYEELTGIFDPKVFELEDAYLNGYFQSEKYFPDKQVIEQLRREFAFKPEEVFTSAESWELYRQIRETKSVSIHVRRGDYLLPGAIETYGGICDTDYYKRAIDLMVSKHPDAIFYVFTSDKEWCEENVSGKKFRIVDTGEENEDAADMLLMSLCKHHILANSSYSWWSAWMNDSPEKMVIVPKKWLNNKAMDDIYTARMTRI